MKLILSTLIVSTFILSLSPTANACSIIQQCPHELKLESSLPSQAKGVVWDLGRTRDDLDALEEHVTLREIDGEQERELAVELRALSGGKYLIVPVEDLQPQLTYEVDVTFPDFLKNECLETHGTSSRTFNLVDVTGATSPTLTAGESERGIYTFTGGSECTQDEDAVHTDVSIQWPAPLADVRDALEVEVLVNGERSYIPVQDDTFTLAATCEDMSRAEGDLPEGDHEVIVRAKLPDTSVQWDSAPLTVPLYCQNSTSGCHTSAAPSTPPAEWLLLGLGFFALRRRSSRRRTNR